MKFHFLRPDATALAEPDTTVIEGIRAELLKRPDISEAADPAQADAIVIHEVWAFREWRYIDRLLAEPVIGRYPHKTYTINVDDAATGLLRGVYTSLPQSRLNPALHAAVPFLLAPNETVLAQAGTARPPPRYLATWRGNPKSNRGLRGRLLRLYGQSSAMRVETTDSWLNHGDDEKRHYAQLLRAGRFALCPAGWAAATIRVFESMALGVAPVILADQNVLPKGPPWSEFSLRVPEAELPRLESLLNQHADRYLEMGERAYEAWRRHFGPDQLIPFYADAVLRCIRASAGQGSRDQEIQRWRSRRMYWTNRWTLPQRVAIKARRLLG